MNRLKKQNRQTRQARVWLLLFLGVVFASVACKPRSRNSGPAQDPIDTAPITEPRVALEKDGDKIHVVVEPLPHDTVAVTCRINQDPEVDCRNGLVMQGLKEGRYKLVVTFVMASGRKEEVREFAVQGNTVTEGTTTSGNVGQEDIRFNLGLTGASANWQNNEAVFRSKPLAFEFALDSNQACLAQILCSFTTDVWALCDYANKPRLDIDPREISEGFQKVTVKAVCDQPKIESKVIDLSWFGVEDDYQTMALTRRMINRTAHYQLVKQNDCLGELKFECGTGTSGAFAACVNVRDNPSAGFQIRATCTTPAGVTRGPIFTES